MAIVSYVIDATVVIDALRARPEATDFLLSLEHLPFASEITRVETIRGLRSQERSSAEMLFDLIRWHPVDETIARTAGEFGRRLRRSHAAVTAPDLIVAATAHVLELPLATSNTKHFPMFKGLKAPY